MRSGYFRATTRAMRLANSTAISDGVLPMARQFSHSQKPSYQPSLSAMEYCVNFGGDCDTNGAMAGAMVGAMAGIDAVPQVWRDKISEMNACNFAKDADEILALIPQWHVASESDVADLIKE